MSCQLWLLFFPIQKRKCLVFTIDGSGDRGINASISIGNKGKLEQFYETTNCIVGRIYSHITLLLGMKRMEHEYKLMGLAPYANNKVDKNIYSVFDDCLKLNGYKIEYKNKPKDYIFILSENFREKDLM